MLHREYVPFIPIRCSKPEGPMDPPCFPPDRSDVPRGFWDESARECFKSARDIMDLVRTCQEWSALVETPIVGFAIYTVAFTGVYCINFPWMDPEGYMCTRPDPSTIRTSVKPGESKGFEAARKALETIGNMRSRLHMADGWFKTINRMHRYFRRLKADYRKNSQAVESSSEGDSPISTRHLSLREGGTGGGLDEFKLLERTLQDFGNLEDQDIEMTDAIRPDSRTLDALYDDSSAGTTVKSEDAGERTDRPPPTSEPPKPEGGAWSAINAAPGASATGSASGSRHASISTPSSGPFRSYESFGHQHHHQAPQQSPPGPNPHQHGYSHQINNFRPAYSDAQGSAGPPSNLTSPAAHPAMASTPSQNQPTPPYERQQQPAYPGWTAQNNQFSMHAPQPPPSPYTNGVSHPHPNPMHPPAPHPAYSTPGPTTHPQHHNLQPPPPMPEVQQQWNPMTKEAWLNSIDTRLGGDDVAAFVDGGELADWANLAATQGFGGGWLSTVWGGGSTTN